MANKRKYEKYFMKGYRTSHDIKGRQSKKNQGLQLLSYDTHDECPFYFEAFLYRANDNYAVQQGGQIEYPPESFFGQLQRRTGMKWYLYPHVHPTLERYHVMSIDPKDPYNLGGTMEVWVNDDKRPEDPTKAEMYSLSKPSIMILPANFRHGPLRWRDMKRDFLFLLISEDNKYRKLSNWEPGKDHLYPPSVDYIVGDGAEKWVPKPQTPEQKNKREFAYLYVEQDVDNFYKLPSTHKGKAHIIHHATWKDSPLIKSRVECILIYGDGIGFGNGNNHGFPPCPMKTSVWSSMSFLSTEADSPSLGGKVEFWMGEGRQAEKYIIEETTTVIIPPNTVYYPIYVHECKRPFVIASIMNEPLFGGRFVDVYPPGFKHVVASKK